MIKRNAENELRNLAAQFKAIALTGPRQSGKSTLVRYVFNDKPYVSLENPDSRRFALEDPRGFLHSYRDGAVIDEVQRVPELFSYLQQMLDETNESGKFVLTGSNNFLLRENISQSLAGRIAYLTLLPFSYDEVKPLAGKDEENLIFKGFYPPLYDQPLEPSRWHSNYISTYVEKDVRQLLNISNHLLFDRFIKLCAGRTGQLLNMNNLAIETGVDNKTVAAWISILESSYIIFRLQPHFRNFNKRLVKTSKLYFYDTGLLANLLGIRDKSQVRHHPLYGSLFENLVISEFLKTVRHLALPVDLYFWRDNTGHEIDLLLEGAGFMLPIEIKAGKTITSEFFTNLQFFQKISTLNNSVLIFAGDELQKRSNGIQVMPWHRISELVNQIGGMRENG